MKRVLLHWLAVALGVTIKINGVNHGVREDEDWESYPK